MGGRLEALSKFAWKRSMFFCSKDCMAIRIYLKEEEEEESCLSCQEKKKGKYFCYSLTITHKFIVKWARSFA